MASRTATLTVKVLVDAAQSAKGVTEATSNFDRLQGTVNRLTPAASVAAAGLAAAGKVVTDSASRQQQAMGAVDSVFKDNASTIKNWASSAAEAVGLSKAEYGEFASVLGAQFNNLGVDAQQATQNTNDLITLGADLAATFGGTTADAVDALSSALRGEADPAERYGLALNQTQINAYLAAQGLDGLEGSALTAAKAQAVVALANQQAGGAMGQFAREADTAAGAQQIATAKWEDAKAALGTALLPAVASVTAGLGEMATFAGQNAGLLQGLAAVVGVLAGGILALNAGMKVYQATTMAIQVATKAWTAVQAAFNVVMNANPVGLIITAVLALVAAIIYAWNNCEGFRNFVIGAGQAIADAWNVTWQAIKVAAGAVWDWITARFNEGKAAIQLVVTAIKVAWNNTMDAIRNVVTGAVTWVMSKFEDVKRGVSIVIQAVRVVWDQGFQAMKSVATTVLDLVMKPVDAIRKGFDAVATAVSNVISWIKRIKWPEPPGWMKSIGNGIGSIFGGGSARSAAAAQTFMTARASLASAPAANTYGSAPAVPRSLVRALATGGGGQGPNISIRVDGALDADRTARQIEALLLRRSRRIGGVRLA